ncbi:MAG TPA: type II toxin-antitoxin system CcdA family antitoxin [Acetobacteraceae bacterium]|jgi:antitoxin CcdA|nr:type II toxin-antitoxin system CcdA family antitoxin [Acetobacteraceae bacterium]
MPTALFDAAARKRTVSLTINQDLYAKAKAAGINVSRVAEEAIAAALRTKQAEVLRDEIRRDQQALARYVAEHGDPVAELRDMFERPPDAA